MLKTNQKIKSYFGFLEKSRQAVYGLDNFEKQRLYLIIYSSSLSEASKKRCLSIAEKNKCKCYELESEDLFELTNNSKIMAVGSKNKELSKAIIGQIETRRNDID